MNMSNGMENLKPIQSVEQAREMGSKGGKASGRARREKKTMKQMLDYLLEKKIATKDGKKATTLEAMMSAAVAKAIKGDIKAAEFVRDTIGQKPKEQVEVSSSTAVQQGINKLKDLL